MSDAPISKVDVAAVAAATTAVGADRALRLASQSIPPESHGMAVRFIDQEVISFAWHGVETYLTPADTVAMLSAAVLLIRFAVWMLAPLWRVIARIARGKKTDQ